MCRYCSTNETFVWHDVCDDGGGCTLTNEPGQCSLRPSSDTFTQSYIIPCLCLCRMAVRSIEDRSRNFPARFPIDCFASDSVVLSLDYTIEWGALENSKSKNPGENMRQHCPHQPQSATTTHYCLSLYFSVHVNHNGIRIESRCVCERACIPLKKPILMFGTKLKAMSLMPDDSAQPIRP